METYRHHKSGCWSQHSVLSPFGLCLDALIKIIFREMDNIFQTSLKMWNLLCSHSLNQTCGRAFKCCMFVPVTAAMLNQSSLGGERPWLKDAARWHWHLLAVGGIDAVTLRSAWSGCWSALRQKSESLHFELHSPLWGQFQTYSLQQFGIMLHVLPVFTSGKLCHKNI